MAAARTRRTFSLPLQVKKLLTVIGEERRSITLE